MSNRKLLIVGLLLVVATAWMVVDAVARGVSAGWNGIEWALACGPLVCSLLLVWVALLPQVSTEDRCVICDDPARVGSFTCGHALCEKQVKGVFRATAQREAERAYLERCFTRNTVK